MKKFILFLLGILILSCNKKENDAVTSTKSAEKAKERLNIQITDFKKIGNTGILIFPLSMRESKSDIDKYSYKDISEYGYWNIIFYNTNNSKYHLVTDKKVLIQNFHYKQDSYDENNQDVYDYIFYTIISDDYDHDKVLTRLDPKYLYVSDNTGNNFRQISPSNYNLISWDFITNTNNVIMTVKKDSNANRIFEPEDEISVFEFNLETSTSPSEIFPKDFKDSLKTLYDRDWKRIK